MLLPHSAHNTVVVVHKTVVLVRILHTRAVGVVDSYHQGPAPIVVVLGAVGRWDPKVDFDTVRVEGVVVRLVLDHIEVVGRFVEVGLELVCFVVGVGLEFVLVVRGVVEKHVEARGIVEEGIVMVDPAGEVGLVVGETVVMVQGLVLEGIAVRVDHVEVVEPAEGV